MEKYKQAALTLASSICRDAVWHNDACNWIGSTSEDYYGMPKAYARSLPTSFYDGTAGVAYFLLSVGQVQKDMVIQRTTHGALQQIIEKNLHSKNENKLPGQLGFHTGLTGCAYVLSKAGEVFKKKQYSDAAAYLVQQCLQLPEEQWGLDIIEGTAGAVPALIALHEKNGDKKLKEFITALGDYLIHTGEKSNLGLSWNTMPDKKANLTGYGHGAAGFAHAFAELYAFTGDKKYVQLMKEIAHYENSHFIREQQNWPDFRNFAAQQNPQQPTQQVCGLAWCHGAPGIGLSRLRAYEVTGEESFKKDAETAVQTTINASHIEALGNYSLCHGLFGNAELLLYAAQVFNRPEYKKIVYQLADDCITHFLNKHLPIPNGLQTGAETPDFMLGSSGIGYFFLRLYNQALFRNLLLITR